MSKLSDIKTVKEQRLKLFAEQETLEEKSCSPCNLNGCHDCDVYKRLQAIGKELISLSQEGRKLKVMSKLTVSLYKELKAQGITDKAIMQQFGMYTNQLVAWKKENGLTRAKEINEMDATTMQESVPKVIVMEAVEKREEVLKQEIAKLENEVNKLTVENEALKTEEGDSSHLTSEYHAQKMYQVCLQDNTSILVAATFAYLRHDNVLVFKTEDGDSKDAHTNAGFSAGSYKYFAEVN